MAETMLYLQGTAYVPGVARGILQPGMDHPDGVALINQAEAADIRKGPVALIVVDGAPLSHRMIGLVAHGVPTVLITAEQAAQLQPGRQVCVDGGEGRITGCDMLPADVRTPSPPQPGQAVQLADGTAVWLMASVRGVDGVREAVDCGAGAIGLVRSEFIGGDRSKPPNAAFFRQAFHDLDKAAGQLPITLRLLDLAADKPPDWLTDAAQLLHPLGMQGARLYLREPVRGVLDAQLEAIAELVEHRPVDVLIPFLGRLQELTHWTQVVRDALPAGVRVGAMLETPAAVMDMAHCSDTADFVAIGCNDLMQCLFGADRDEPSLRDDLDPYAPILYRLLHQALTDAGGHTDAVRLCGVLPRLPGTLPVLVGLGFRRFSVDPAWIPYLARELSAVTLNHVQDLAKRVMSCRYGHTVRTMLRVPDETR
jgi:phosphoenolpyruvate-protein kinase (PTS system EI component)